jgi:hypothetical protein
MPSSFSRTAKIMYHKCHAVLFNEKSLSLILPLGKLRERYFAEMSGMVTQIEILLQGSTLNARQVSRLYIIRQALKNEGYVMGPAIVRIQSNRLVEDLTREPGEFEDFFHFKNRKKLISLLNQLHAVANNFFNNSATINEGYQPRYLHALGNG